jgi:hypothetical protein
MNQAMAAVLFLVLAMLALVLPAQPKLTPAEKGMLLQNVNLVLLLNDAEEVARTRQGHFAPFAELVKSGALEEAARGPYARIYGKLDVKQETEPLSGFELGIVVSADGAAYKLSLAQKAKCGKVFFSDQRKQIYFGQPLECPAD